MFVSDTKQVVISCSTSGVNTLVAAPTDGGFIAVDNIVFVPDSAVTITIKSGSTAKTGAMSLTANQGFALENVMHTEKGIITCAPDEALVLNLSSAVQVSGFLNYRICNR